MSKLQSSRSAAFVSDMAAIVGRPRPGSKDGVCKVVTLIKSSLAVPPAPELQIDVQARNPLCVLRNIRCADLSLWTIASWA